MKFGLILVCVIGALLAFVYFSDAGPEPQLTDHDRLHRASCSIQVVKDEMKEWPVPDKTITAYEYFKGPAFAKVDGNWYGLNGMASGWAKKEKIKEAGQLQSIRQLEDLPTPGPAAGAAQRSLSFLLSLNDQVNRRCPS